MSKPIDRAEADALQLSAGERTRVAHSLLRSLDANVVEDPAEA
jgi:hypothetical protein